MEQQVEVDVMIAEASHEVYVDTILKTIEDLGKESRAKLYREHLPCEFDLIAYCDSSGHLIDLEAGDVPVDPDDLALQAALADNDVCHLVLDDAPAEAGSDHVAVDRDDMSCIL